MVQHTTTMPLHGTPSHQDLPNTIRVYLRWSCYLPLMNKVATAANNAATASNKTNKATTAAKTSDEATTVNERSHNYRCTAMVTSSNSTAIKRSHNCCRQTKLQLPPLPATNEATTATASSDKQSRNRNCYCYHQ